MSTPEDLLNFLFSDEQHGDDCRCKDCRLKRGEAYLKDVLELRPDQTEAMNVMMAKKHELVKILDRAVSLQKELEALRTLFWLRVESQVGGPQAELSVDRSRMVVQELVSIEKGKGSE